MQLFRIFCIGLGISFLGTLPLGTLNVAAMQIAVTDGLQPALMFSLGALTSRDLLCPSFPSWPWTGCANRKAFPPPQLDHPHHNSGPGYLIFSSLPHIHPVTAKNVILSNITPRFCITMSAINPVQIPFWFGWSTVLTKNILQPKPSHYNTYISGIGIGTFLGNAVFIFGGESTLNANQSILNYIIGGVFAVTALIQAWRMFRSPSSSSAT